MTMLEIAYSRGVEYAVAEATGQLEKLAEVWAKEAALSIPGVTEEKRRAQSKALAGTAAAVGAGALAHKYKDTVADVGRKGLEHGTALAERGAAAAGRAAGHATSLADKARKAFKGISKAAEYDPAEVDKAHEMLMNRPGATAALMAGRQGINTGLIGAGLGAGLGALAAPRGFLNRAPSVEDRVRHGLGGAAVGGLAGAGLGAAGGAVRGLSAHRFARMNPDAMDQARVEQHLGGMGPEDWGKFYEDPEVKALLEPDGYAGDAANDLVMQKARAQFAKSAANPEDSRLIDYAGAAIPLGAGSAAVGAVRGAKQDDAFGGAARGFAGNMLGRIPGAALGAAAVPAAGALTGLGQAALHNYQRSQQGPIGRFFNPEAGYGEAAMLGAENFMDPTMDGSMLGVAGGAGLGQWAGGAEGGRAATKKYRGSAKEARYPGYLVDTIKRQARPTALLGAGAGAAAGGAAGGLGAGYVHDKLSSDRATLINFTKLLQT